MNQSYVSRFRSSYISEGVPNANLSPIFVRVLVHSFFFRYLVIKAMVFMLWPLCYRIAALVIPKVSSNQTFQRNWRPPFSYQKTKKSPNNIRVLWSRHRSEGKNWKRYVTRLLSHSGLKYKKKIAEGTTLFVKMLKSTLEFFLNGSLRY